jgi:tripartite-type tricarboxylate transporter receptor subunit TctC
MAINPKLPFNNLKEPDRLRQEEPRQAELRVQRQRLDPAHRRRAVQAAHGHLHHPHPYRGSGPAVQDLMGGQVDMFITTPAGVVSQIQGGKLKGMAVTGTQRLASLPQCADGRRAGSEGLRRWTRGLRCMRRPARLRTIVQQLNTEVNKDPDFARGAQEGRRVGHRRGAMTPRNWATSRRRNSTTGARSSRAKITLE